MSRYTAISPQEFAGKAWTRAGFAFAQKDQFVPVVLAELTQLAPAMPLVFVPMGDSYQLMGLTAVQPGSNLYVAPDGQWLGDYAPALLRAYPFRLVKQADRDDSILCIDADSGRVVDAGQGDAFFDDSGTPSQAIKDIIALLTQAEGSRLATQKAVDALHAAGLIRPWNLTAKDGDTLLKVDGLFRVDEAGLNALPDDAFLSLRPSGALNLAYTHLLSLHQVNEFAKLRQVQQQLRAKAAPQPAAQAMSIDNLGMDFGSVKFR